MRLFPVQIALNNRLCLLVGAGPVAERKVATLRGYGAKIRVVAPDATAPLRELAADGKIEWRQRPYETADLEGAFLVFAATNSPDVNRKVAADAEAHGILVCRTDNPTGGSFLSVSAVHRGDLAITVSTSGSSPTLASVLRMRLAQQFGPEWDALTQLIRHLRPQIQQISGDTARKVAVANVIDDREMMRLLAAGNTTEAEERARLCLFSSSE